MRPGVSWRTASRRRQWERKGAWDARALLQDALALMAVSLSMVGGIGLARDMTAAEHYQELANSAAANSDDGEGGRAIDWEALGAINPDVAGWLTVGNAGINLPVVREGPAHVGDWYLAHDFWGRPSALGCPYIDPRCALDDSHILILGHTTDDQNALFGPLHGLSTQDDLMSIGSATWTTPAHGTRDFSPFLILEVDRHYPTIQRFGSLSTEETRALLHELVADAQAVVQHRRQLIDRTQSILTLVTCASARVGEQSRKVVVFTSP